MRSWSLFLSPRFFDLPVLCKEQILPQTPRHYPNLDISEPGRIFLYKFNIIQRLLWFVMLLNNRIILSRISIFRYILPSNFIKHFVLSSNVTLTFKSNFTMRKSTFLIWRGRIKNEIHWNMGKNRNRYDMFLKIFDTLYVI